MADDRATELRRELLRRELARRREITPKGHANVPEFIPLGVEGYDPKTGMVEKPHGGRTGAFLSGAVEGLPIVGPTAQSGVENVAAGLGSLISGQPAEKVREEMGGMVDRAQEAHPGYTTAGNVTGGVLGSAAAIGAAPAAFGVAPGMTMVTQMLRGGLSSAGLGGADVAARGGDMGDIAAGAALSGGLGTVGAPVASAVQHAGRTIGGTFGIGNAGRAKQAIADALLRSGRSAKDVAVDLTEAAADGQGVYALADALGHPGQRMLSGVARSPGDMRQTIVESLDARQAGQGRRVASFLDDAFGSAQGTALQREAAEKATRSADAGVNYGASRAAAGAVDSSAAIKAIDDVIQPGVTPMVGAGAVDDSVYGTLAKAKSYLTDGKAVVSDFDRAFRAKVEMDGIIKNGGPAAQLLKPARDALDDALANASKPYANARDTYRQQSKAVEAVDVGRQSAKRGRFEDTIPRFQGMSPEEQAGFRTGYADPLIESTQGAPVGVNKARPLISDATEAEFPAFAVPGKADQLGRRIGREHTMFETRGQALGGSRTADNLADMADVGSFDPSMIGNLLTGRFGAATQAALAKGANALQGRNQATRDMIAEALLSTAPTKATAALADAVKHGEQISARQMAVVKALLSGGVPLANVPAALQQ
jgi:hypothetical protein